MLDYFCTEKIVPGAIVQIRISSRKLLAVAISCFPISQQKMRIKKSPYKLRAAEKIVNPQCVYPRHYLKLILWASSYYYSPAGLMLKTLFPWFFSKPTGKFLEEIASEEQSPFKDQSETAGKNIPILIHANSGEGIKFLSQSIGNAVSEGKSVLFIVPELYKMDYWQNKISRLKNAAIVHSKLTPKKEYDIWKTAVSGNSQIILGTRAALSIHVANLGLIIIDEEESSYHKSFDQQPYINTRDIALKLAELAGAKIILASDLPSLETLWQVKNETYRTPDSKFKSASRRTNSKFFVQDMREELKNGNYSIFSKALQEKLRQTIGNEKQAVLFINRRGLATGLLCRDCGHVIKCPNCDIPMTYHRNLGSQLRCHHCARVQNPPSVCPKCQSYRIKFMGTGTQRVAQELEKFCEENGLKVKSAVIDTDHTKGSSEQKKIFDQFRDKKVSILIGTQLMLKTGLLGKYEFAAAITLDPLFSIPDFRMNERVFRILRKLQTNSESEIILQTYNPDNPSLKHILESPDFSEFADKELETRKALSYPPFSQIIKLTYSHVNSERAEQDAKILLNKLKVQTDMLHVTSSTFQLLGPAPAFIPREKNRYIWHIMIKSKLKDPALRNKLLRVVPSGWKVDVDPIELL